MNKVFQDIPEHLRPRNSGAARLFVNSFMERITRTHVLVPIIMHSIIVLFLVYVSWSELLQGIPGISFSIPVYVLLFVAGWFAWTLFEYVLHRWVYHINTDNKIILAIQHAGHGIHHQFPRDPTRLAMPPLTALLLQVVVFGLFWLMMQNFTFAFFPGFLTGYIAYITLHYLEHCVRPPKFELLHKLWKWHALHHYKYPETRAFGVSTNLWDVIFGTQPEE